MFNNKGVKVKMNTHNILLWRSNVTENNKRKSSNPKVNAKIKGAAVYDQTVDSFEDAVMLLPLLTCDQMNPHRVAASAIMPIGKQPFEDRVLPCHIQPARSNTFAGWPVRHLASQPASQPSARPAFQWQLSTDQ